MYIAIPSKQILNEKENNSNKNNNSFKSKEVTSTRHEDLEL